MPYLPLPPLEQTLARYEEIVAPLLDEREAARTAEAVAEFAAHDGPRAQQALERRAAEANAAGTSWLSDLWHDTYLATRTPLPLTSNVGFELTWPEDDHGLDRAARLAHRFARVHLHHVRGELDPDVSPRGDVLCMQQWRCLAGGMRRPRPGQDDLVPGAEHAASHEIVVLHCGRAHAVPVSDEAGHVVPLPTLRAALARVVEASEGATPVGWAPGATPPFSAWSYLGGDDAAAYEDEVLADDHNAAVHERLTDALFLLSLLDGDETKDTDADASRGDGDRPDDATADLPRLVATGFDYGIAWPYKPVTYVVDLAGRYVGMHVEHTIADGATVQTVVGLAQDLVDEPEATDEEGGITAETRETPPDLGAPEPLEWHLTDDVRARLARDVAAYEENAATRRVRLVRTPVIDPGSRRVSADALQQFVLLFAQLRTYGRVRSTYESVDMREYQGGRTETMRPVSPQAVALAQALLAGEGTHDLLEAALAEHKRRIVACKKGEAVDRHLLGLRAAAADLGLTPALFEDVAHARLTEDFLSTTSLGTDERIPRYVFAPTSEGGLGVEYGRRSTGEYEFLVVHGPARDGDVAEFTAAIVEGVTRLDALVSSWAASPAPTDRPRSGPTGAGAGTDVPPAGTDGP